jgi:hypothetical protein
MDHDYDDMSYDYVAPLPADTVQRHGELMDGLKAEERHAERDREDYERELIGY